MDAETHPVAGRVWIDVRQADEQARRRIEQAAGISLPTIADLQEIESSSRLYAEDGALFMSLPVLAPVAHGVPAGIVPLGFVLTSDHVLTLRDHEIAGLDSPAARRAIAAAHGQPPVGVLVTLLEALVDHSADVLERLSEDLDKISHRIFREPAARARTDMELRATLRSIGRTGEVVTKLRDTLLGISRILPFLAANAADRLTAELKPRMKTLRADVASLMDHDAHLQQRVSFLLDATLGFINNEQSNIIKVMTVVSVVFMPPTLVASIYGMNFAVMPELHWHYGYAYALVLIVAGAVLPLAWFRARRWL
jgi:magnesium transporter